MNSSFITSRPGLDIKCAEKNHLGGQFEMKVVHETTELIFPALFMLMLSVYCALIALIWCFNQNYIPYCMNYVSEGANLQMNVKF